MTRVAAARPSERYHPCIDISEQEPSPDGREMSRRAAIVLGALVAAVGLGVLALAFWGSGEKFHAPRWVIAACGGAFVFFGGWTAVVYALGYDPRRSEETLPPPLVQLAFFVPGIVFLALPFHWVAFGPGPRAFSGSFSLPFLWISRRSGELSGRVAFGIGAVVMDLIVVAITVTLLRRAARQ